MFTQLIHDGKSIYGTNESGGLLWYRDLKDDGTNAPDGSIGWAPNSGHQIGVGWNTLRVFAGSEPGDIFAIAEDGRLLWYRDLVQDGSNRSDGGTGWDGASGQVVATGWNAYTQACCGNDGVMYVITASGDLTWHKYEKRRLQSGVHGPLHTTVSLVAGSGRRIGAGWQGVNRLLFSAVVRRVVPSVPVRTAVLYAVKPGGELLWFRDDREDGSNNPAGTDGWAAGSGSQIGVGWNMPLVMSAPGGVFYVVKPDGTLHWYRDDAGDGTSNAAGKGWAPHSGSQIGQGWSVASIECVSAASKPRHDSGIGARAYSFTSGFRRKTQLTFSVTGTLQGVDYVGAVAAAQRIWQKAAPALQFLPGGANADLNFVVADLSAVNFPGGSILGNTAPDGRTIQMNSKAGWAASGQARLIKTVTHELGHALGLGHSTKTAATMFPFVPRSPGLDDEDVLAIRALYGWSEQQKIPGVGTEQTPALCVCGGVLAMAWRGSGDDRNIWFSTSANGKDWTPQHRVSGAATIASPSLAWDGTRVWMAWRGIGDDQNLYFANSTDLFQTNTSGVAQVAAFASSHGPTMAFVAGQMWLLWKGIGGDSGVYFSFWTGSAWQGQQKIGGVGTAGSPAICRDLTNVPRAVWRGTGDDQSLWTSALTGQFWQPQRQVSWIRAGNGSSGTIGVGYPGSKAGPQLAWAPGATPSQGRLLAVWRGIDGDQQLYFTQLSNDVVGASQVDEWSQQLTIPNTGSSHGVAVAFFAGLVVVVCKGIEGDTGIYTAAL